MAGPPKNVEAKDLFQKLCESPQPSDVVDFPRKDDEGNPVFRVRIMVLGMEEHDQCRVFAMKRLKKKLRIEDGASAEQLAEMSTDIMREVLGDMVARELLCMACHTEDPIEGIEPTQYGRIFLTPERITEARVTADELTTLFAAYNLIQNKWGPFEATIANEAELNHWIDTLARGSSAYPLAQRSSHQLVELTMSLARRASTLSDLLVSQWKDLPPTLRSDLDELDIGIGSHGEEPADDKQSRTDTSDVTIEGAKTFAEDFLKK